MFQFFKSKALYINLITTIILIIAVVWGIFRFIDNYTHHGETISVPSLEGLNLKELETILKEKKLRFFVQDSIFKDKAEKGIILDQNPLAESLVKENRTIYVTISKRTTPKITMPDVVGGSQRMAVAKLKSYGLKIVKTEFKPSEYSGTVLSHKIGSKQINPGDKVDEGSKLTLVIGSGKGSEKIMAPYLIGLTKDEAETELQSSSLNVGFNDYTDCKCITAEDTLNAKIYKQEPIRSENVALYIGSSVDLYFTCDSTIIDKTPFIAVDDSTNTTNSNE